jgi:hypothetical protein
MSVNRIILTQTEYIYILDKDGKLTSENFYKAEECEAANVVKWWIYDCEDIMSVCLALADAFALGADPEVINYEVHINELTNDLIALALEEYELTGRKVNLKNKEETWGIYHGEKLVMSGPGLLSCMASKRKLILDGTNANKRKLH